MARSTPLRRRDRAGRWPLLGRRAAIFATLWWVSTGGDAASWWIGVPCVLIAAQTSLTLSPHRRFRVRPPGLAAFVPVFLRRTIGGSVDVAWRALHPRMPLDPDLVHYRLRFPAGPGRLVFASLVNLLPGTVCAEIEGDHLLLHVIDRRQALDAQLAALERRVAAMLASAPGEPP